MVDKLIKSKCVIVGDTAVGKTSLISCFVQHSFPSDYKPTIGTNLYVKELKPEIGIDYQLICWDIAGESKWTTMRKLYYSGASGALMVGDLTIPETFTNLVDYWRKDLSSYCEDIPIILLANKLDLGSKIPDEEVQEIGRKITASRVFYTSAKTGKNVDAAFIALVQAMIDESKP